MENRLSMFIDGDHGDPFCHRFAHAQQTAYHSAKPYITWILFDDCGGKFCHFRCGYRTAFRFIKIQGE